MAAYLLDTDICSYVIRNRPPRARERMNAVPLDLIIAAHARSLGAIMVTHNRRHFDKVPGLKVESWA